MVCLGAVWPFFSRAAAVTQDWLPTNLKNIVSFFTFWHKKHPCSTKDCNVPDLGIMIYTDRYRVDKVLQSSELLCWDDKPSVQPAVQLQTFVLQEMNWLLGSTTHYLPDTLHAIELVKGE